MVVNNYFEFQVDTFNSLKENDSHEKLNQRRRTSPLSSDDNTSTFFLRKVELIKYGIQVPELRNNRWKSKWCTLTGVYICEVIEG